MYLNKFIACAALLLGAATPGYAVTITFGGTAVANQGLQTSVASTTTVDFNSGVAPTTGFVTYSGGSVFTGNVPGVSAAPPNDTSAYFSVGPTTTATITFTEAVDYFGFYAGSLDSYNVIQFFNGTTQVASLTGTQIGSSQSSAFVNLFSQNSGEFFTSIRLTSSSPAFETDNHAFRTVAATAIPEPSPLIALLAFGISGAALAWKRRQSALQ